MANTSAILAQLLAIKTQENIYSMDSIRWNAKYNANAERMSDQQGYQDKWETKYDSAYTAGADETLKAGGQKWSGSRTSGNAAQSRLFANKCVPKYDSDACAHYEALDIQYDTIKSTYDTMLEELGAQKESLQSKLSEAAKDKGLIE